MMTMEKYKLIILVKHGLYPEFIELTKEAQGKTWLSDTKPLDVKVIHYYGIPVGRLVQKLDKFHEFMRWHSRWASYLIATLMYVLSLPFLAWIPKTRISNEIQAHDTEIQCQVIDTIFTLRWKQLSIYNYVLKNYQFEYVFETNASSYIDFTNLLREIDKFTQSPLYAGNTPTPKFVSGANRILDRESLTAVQENRIHWNPAFLEDVAIGKLMKYLRIPTVAMSSISVTNLMEVQMLKDDLLRREYHFRTKSFVGEKRNDAILMRALHDRFATLIR